MEKRATHPNSTMKSFPYKATSQTPKVPSQSSPTKKAKNQVKNHAQKHKHTKKNGKGQKDSNSPKKNGLPSNKL